VSVADSGGVSSHVSAAALEGRLRTGTRGRVARVSTNLGLQLIGISIGLLIWELLSIWQGDFVLPGPLDTARHIADNLFHSEYLTSHGLSQGGGYLPHLWYTTQNVLIGVGVGTLVGVAIGLASLRLKVLHEIANSITAVFGTAPIFVAAPFFLIWFGIVSTAQIMIVAFYTALLMYVFSRRAGENIAAAYIESGLTLGATRWTIFRRINLPGSIPEMTGGFRIALAGAWGLAGIAELLGAQEGAGFLIKFYATAFVVDGMLALIVLLGLIAIIVDRIVVELSRHLTRWSEAGRSFGR
jgi:ABC-type nitrate/sulfonate/bicarbonate transport system permease component